jgi:hypothetical protein
VPSKPAPNPTDCGALDVAPRDPEGGGEPSIDSDRLHWHWDESRSFRAVPSRRRGGCSLLLPAESSSVLRPLFPIETLYLAGLRLLGDQATAWLTQTRRQATAWLAQTRRQAAAWLAQTGRQATAWLTAICTGEHECLARQLLRASVIFSKINA